MHPPKTVDTESGSAMCTSKLNMVIMITIMIPAPPVPPALAIAENIIIITVAPTSAGSRGNKSLCSQISSSQELSGLQSLSSAHSSSEWVLSATVKTIPYRSRIITINLTIALFIKRHFYSPFHIVFLMMTSQIYKNGTY